MSLGSEGVGAAAVVLGTAAEDGAATGCVVGVGAMVGCATGAAAEVGVGALVEAGAGAAAVALGVAAVVLGTGAMPAASMSLSTGVCPLVVFMRFGDGQRDRRREPYARRRRCPEP